MPARSRTITSKALRLEKRNADEYRLWHGSGREAVYCGHITYTARYGWDAYNLLDHKYVPSGPFGIGDAGLEKAQAALRLSIIRRGDLTNQWDQDKEPSK